MTRVGHSHGSALEQGRVLERGSDPCRITIESGAGGTNSRDYLPPVGTPGGQCCDRPDGVVIRW